MSLEPTEDWNKNGRLATYLSMPVYPERVHDLRIRLRSDFNPEFSSELLLKTTPFLTAAIV